MSKMWPLFQNHKAHAVDLCWSWSDCCLMKLFSNNPTACQINTSSSIPGAGVFYYHQRFSNILFHWSEFKYYCSEEANGVSAQEVHSGTVKQKQALALDLFQGWKYLEYGGKWKYHLWGPVSSWHDANNGIRCSLRSGMAAQTKLPWEWPTGSYMQHPLQSVCLLIL